MFVKQEAELFSDKNIGSSSDALVGPTSVACCMFLKIFLSVLWVCACNKEY